ncbi:hypothetical protein [Brucella tritici]|uniref:Apea-like HEPN domain-containing protein n=1 Tax=Brucella tritici TaxID=94626 RepID=A0A6L3YMV6_9HYPH|nr:hypothetical protein [Brucella tritici]KAB2684399.1 hypothetical protein F9L08_14005 [Brucella tritici]
MSVDVTAANNLPPRADELFRIFARFEFALKMAGYAKMDHGMVKICWDDFAKSDAIGDKFFREVDGSKTLPLLMNDPPKADRILDGRYGFEDRAQPPKCVIELFRHVRRVRNNLFHGGKYFDYDIVRSEQLIAEAIYTLLLACERHPDVNFFFEGRA